MDINTTEFAQFLNHLIEQKSKIIIQQELNRYGNLRAWDAIIQTVSGNTASVKLIGDDTTIIGVKNKSGVTNLVAGDEVYLHSISSLSNAYIAVAKNKPI